jgi:hypothetical protein
LDINRTALLARLQAPEVEYFEKNWRSKEFFVTQLTTSLFNNLRCFSTQRNESFHPVVKATLNPQISLATACYRLSTEVKEISLKLHSAENQGRANVPRILDYDGFRLLIGKVIHTAMELLPPEWENAKSSALFEEPYTHDCSHQCSIISQHRLPCRHWLLWFALEGIPVNPRLLHLR